MNSKIVNLFQRRLYCNKNSVEKEMKEAFNFLGMKNKFIEEPLSCDSIKSCVVNKIIMNSYNKKDMKNMYQDLKNGKGFY